MKLLILFFIFPFLILSGQNQNLLKEVGPLLKSNSWPYHVFAVLRMEKYPTQDAVKKTLLSILSSHKFDWRVKAFAFRTMARIDIEVPSSLILKIRDPNLIKAAMIAGIEIPNQHLENIVSSNSRSKDEEVIFTICEIAALSHSDRARKTAQARFKELMSKADLQIVILYGKRICRFLGIKYSRLYQWKSMGKMFAITTPEKYLKALNFKRESYFTGLEQEDFIKCSKYYEGFHKKDLEVMVAIDGTGSMRYVIEDAQKATADLVEILGTFSKSLKFGVVVYRDKEDGRPQIFKLSNKYSSVIEFISKIKAQGGDKSWEEWVLSGIEKAESAGWKSNALKHLFVIGDAPPHNQNVPQILSAVKKYKLSKDITTHAIVSYTKDIKEFQDMAKAGNGRYLKLEESTDLANLLMKFPMDPFVHEFFDEFYRLYKIYCK